MKGSLPLRGKEHLAHQKSVVISGSIHPLLCCIHVQPSIYPLKFDIWSNLFKSQLKDSKLVMKLRPCSDYQPNQFLAYPDCIQIVWTAKKNTWSPVFVDRIQTTFGGGLKCDSNGISADAPHSGCSGFIPDTLAAKIRFQSVSCVTHNTTHNKVKSRVVGVLEFTVL